MFYVDVLSTSPTIIIPSILPNLFSFIAFFTASALSELVLSFITRCQLDFVADNDVLFQRRNVAFYRCESNLIACDGLILVRAVGASFVVYNKILSAESIVYQQILTLIFVGKTRDV